MAELRAWQAAANPTAAITLESVAQALRPKIHD